VQSESRDDGSDGATPFQARHKRREKLRSSVQATRSYLRDLTVTVQAFRSILLHAQASDRAMIIIPEEFAQAWLHFLMSIIHSPHNEPASTEQLEVAGTLMMTGMRMIIESLSQKSLLEKSVVLPLEIVSLISLTLLKDVTGKYTNISVAYSEYLKALVRRTPPHRTERVTNSP
jgi:hypothetical protein